MYILTKIYGKLGLQKPDQVRLYNYSPNGNSYNRRGVSSHFGLIGKLWKYIYKTKGSGASFEIFDHQGKDPWLDIYFFIYE